MDTTVSITNSRENELQFDISVEGTDVSEMRARFVIEMGDVEYVFPCKQSDTAARWNVKIPKMPHLKTGTYDFHVEIITNGYYFDPYKGKIEITPEPTVSQSDVSKKVPVPTVKAVVVKGDDKKEDKEESVKEDIDKKSEDLVTAFLNNKKARPTVTESDKDKAAKAVLKEMKKPAKKLMKKSTDKIELAPIKKRVNESKSPPKKRVVKKRKVVVKEDTTSALDKAIENIDVPKDEQALKVRNIINSVKDEE